MKMGAYDFIQKPVDFDAFRAVIEGVGMFWLAVNKAPPPEVFTRVRLRVIEVAVRPDGLNGS